MVRIDADWIHSFICGVRGEIKEVGLQSTLILPGMWYNYSINQQPGNYQPELSHRYIVFSLDHPLMFQNLCRTGTRII